MSDLADDPYFIPKGGGTHRKPFAGVEIHAVAGEGMMLSLVDLAAGSVVPEHSHPHEQMGMMISGRAEFTIGGVTRIVEPGDVWRIPGGVPHMVRTLGEGPAVALDVFHPVRDDYR
jgi:quercetin dioxygenase-like cupin family protein